jgi:opacity protein-like surface antigen
MRFIKLFIPFFISFSVTLCAQDYFGCNLFGGFYAGAGGGMTIDTSKINIEETFQGLNTGIPSSSFDLNSDEQGKWREKQGVGEIFAGYGCQLPLYMPLYGYINGYLGIRAGLNFPSFFIRTTNLIEFEETVLPFIESSSAAINNRIEIRHWGAEGTFDGKLGIIFSNKSLFFGLVGVAFNRPKIKVKEITVFIPPSGVTFTEIFRLSKKGRHAHFRWGIGLEQMITPCLSLSALYTSTHYNKVRLIGTGTVVEDDTTLSETAAISVEDRRRVFSLSSSYYF